VAAASLAVIYLLVDAFPPRHFAIAAGIRDTTYDDYARQYARALARSGVDLEVRNYPGAIEHFAALRDRASGPQAAIAGFGFTEPSDADELYSLGGISDSPVFVFYRGADTITQFAQMRGKPRDSRVELSSAKL